MQNTAKKVSLAKKLNKITKIRLQKLPRSVSENDIETFIYDGHQKVLLAKSSLCPPGPGGSGVVYRCAVTKIEPPRSATGMIPPKILNTLLNY